MDRKTIDIVQELLAAEQASIALRLAESTLFVAPPSAAEASALGRIAGEINEHSAWLVDVLARAGRSPGPRISDLSTADLHFQEISFALPRLTADLTRLAHLCERAATEVATDQTVAPVVARMTERHRKHVEKSAALSGTAASDPA
ncbi:MAG: hypothetical protein IIB55_08975, partial [Planctomycetes bacterium]|nr:hypothetical protein [Planctomycetota bacterium]